MWLIKNWFLRIKKKIILFFLFFVPTFEECLVKKKIFDLHFCSIKKRIDFYSLGKTPDPSIELFKKFFVRLLFLWKKDFFHFCFLSSIKFYEKSRRKRYEEEQRKRIFFGVCKADTKEKKQRKLESFTNRTCITKFFVFPKF